MTFPLGEVMTSLRPVHVVIVTLLCLTSFIYSVKSCEARVKDDNIWLEEVEGEEALRWVRARNAVTTTSLEQGADYAKLYADARAIVLAKDRVPFAKNYRGQFYNFWQDETHVRGLWRRTTADQYAKPQPKWNVLLDFDALATAEKEDWVYKGAPWLTKTSSRRLLRLSRGGKDAAVTREFDVETKRFVTDGFNLPEAKSSVAGESEDNLLLATDEGADSLTISGYPRVVRRWRRGQPLAQAELIFTAPRDHLGVDPFVVQHGAEVHSLLTDSLDFWRRHTYVIEGTKTRRLPFPETARFLDLRRGRAILQLKESLQIKERTFPAGAIVSCGIEGDVPNDVRLIFAPDARQSIEDVGVGADRVLLSLIEDVRGKVIEVTFDATGAPKSRALELPTNGVLTYEVADEDDRTSFDEVSFTNYLTPLSTYRMDQDRLTPLKSSPARFDASTLEVQQHFATSRDGTRVPYFVVAKKGLALDGTNPTLLYGYGGFEASMTPYYSGVTGKLWLERGGVYVVANIRGGGEYGPAWHRAALRENRQRAFDDFIAVAEDLQARKVTSPKHLGIQGGSNGGLLVGAVMVQRPELFNAVLIQVPLLDMRRYSKLLAGASWMGEYGDPDKPEDWAFISKYSPYQNVRAEVTYPTPMFTTSTKDDRVHPGHARKMAARMLALGKPIYYFENTNGGHAGAANLDETIHISALEYAYMWERLR